MGKTSAFRNVRFESFSQKFKEVATLAHRLVSASSSASFRFELRQFKQKTTAGENRFTKS